ncbi:hypothetical protein [Nonomuraea dietziae]|uniref:hypothetical protein n=1 Tax=Nonomuraea dietziae TaxID=65515 RepID=UPI0033DFB8E3
MTPIRHRDELPWLKRAVSDTLDELNHRMHGLTSSWAYPDEFLDCLAAHGYTVVPDSLLKDAEAALADLGACEDTECEVAGCSHALVQLRAARARTPDWEAS